MKRLVFLLSLALWSAPALAEVRAGAAVVDSTAQVGYSAGQYASDGTAFVNDHGIDPTTHQTRRVPSYGIESRETVRALVVEGPDGTRVALVANDLYIPQDLINRRIAGILEQYDIEVGLGLHGPEAEPTGITAENLTVAVSHSHTSPYYSTPSWGVWAFQDVFDIRFFERHAQAQAQAVIQAVNNLVPVRMGASVRSFAELHRHSYGPQVADDGTPSGYPQTDNDKTVIVVRFDDVSDSEDPTPIAHWVIYGGHPEFLDGNDLLSGEYVHRMYRFVDRSFGPGHVTLMTQQNVGTAEPGRNADAQPPEARAEYSHREYAQMERAGRILADAVLATSGDIAAGTPEFPGLFVPFATDFVVDSVDLRLAGPGYRVFPSVSNCRSEAAFDGNPGIPVAGLPDCEHTGFALPPEIEEFGFDPGITYEALRGVGIVPDNTSAPSYTGLQETLQVHLQAIRLGEIAVTVCPCEQFADQSRNIKSRLDKVPDNLHIGWDWAEEAAFCTQNPDTSWTCKNPGNPSGAALAPVDNEAYQHMLAQIHNDADGWEDPSYAPFAENEPLDWTQVKGNYTHEELTGFGYDLVIPIAMSNDYWGYIVTYREFQAKDHYRKALTGLGPHSSDYFATRLTRMAASLNGAPELELRPQDLALAPEGAHQEARAAVIGNHAAVHTAAYNALLPADGGTPGVTQEPVDIQRFEIAHVKWVGGANHFDVPRVVVERSVGGEWIPFADQSGEVQVLVNYPQPEDLLDYGAGLFEWVWEATFEAFDSDIELVDLQGNPLRQVPDGLYRFAIEGVQHDGVGATTPYQFSSAPFTVEPWEGISVDDFQVAPDGSVSFTVGPVSTFFGDTFGPVDYPDTYASPFDAFIRNEREEFGYAGGHQEQFCFHCSFRPWADTGEVVSAMVTVNRAAGGVETVAAALDPDGRWRAPTALAVDDSAFVARGGVVDEFGEINGAPSVALTGADSACGLGFEIALLVPAWWWWRRRRGARTGALLGALALALLAAPEARAGSIDHLPPVVYVGGFGERVEGVANNTSYFAQSFVAPVHLTLDTLEFVLQPQSPGLDNAGDNVFHLLITETTGSGGTLRPTDSCGASAGVCFESGELTMPLGGPEQTFNVALGGLTLDPGQTYAFVLDAFVTGDGVAGKSAVGATSTLNGYDGGHFFFLNLTEASGSERADHFAEVGSTWNDFFDEDLAFRLSFTPVPEPASALLLGLGLAWLGGRGRRGGNA